MTMVGARRIEVQSGLQHLARACVHPGVLEEPGRVEDRPAGVLVELRFDRERRRRCSKKLQASFEVAARERHADVRLGVNQRLAVTEQCALVRSHARPRAAPRRRVARALASCARLLSAIASSRLSGNGSELRLDRLRAGPAPRLARSPASQWIRDSQRTVAPVASGSPSSRRSASARRRRAEDTASSRLVASRRPPRTAAQEAPRPARRRATPRPATAPVRDGSRRGRARTWSKPTPTRARRGRHGGAAPTLREPSTSDSRGRAGNTLASSATRPRCVRQAPPARARTASRTLAGVRPGPLASAHSRIEERIAAGDREPKAVASTSAPASRATASRAQALQLQPVCAEPAGSRGERPTQRVVGADASSTSRTDGSLREMLEERAERARHCEVVTRAGQHCRAARCSPATNARTRLVLPMPASPLITATPLAATTTPAPKAVSSVDERIVSLEQRRAEMLAAH